MCALVQGRRFMQTRKLSYFEVEHAKFMIQTHLRKENLFCPATIYLGCNRIIPGAVMIEEVPTNFRMSDFSTK